MSFVFRLVILFGMIFCHLFADYNMQGILAKMKQRSWWAKNPEVAGKRFYAKDYAMALFEHAFMWTFVTTIPLLGIAIWLDDCYLAWVLIGSYIINTVLHAMIDNLKANRRSINLIEDQFLHLLQILLTWIVAMAAI